MLDDDSPQPSWQELPGLEALVAGDPQVLPGELFRPTDPGQEARSHNVPSGLVQEFAEDLDGLEDEEPFGLACAERPVTAIDAGVVRLGSTADGIIGAVRAAAVTRFPGGGVKLRLYRPGTFLFTSSNRLNVLHQMGRALGKPDFYVHLDENGRPAREKIQLAAHDHRLLDRARNLVERLVQKAICSELEEGIVVLDGALTLRTFDTPGFFLRKLHDLCQERDLSLLAVAKKTGLTIRGVDIRLLLEREVALPCRRKLTRALKLEETRKKGNRDSAPRWLGDLYVARFAPAGDVYRVDVDAPPGATSAEALDEFHASCLFRNGYPEALIEAHIHSYFTPPLVAQLQAHAIGTYEFIPMPEPNLGPVFAPFGGRFK